MSGSKHETGLLIGRAAQAIHSGAPDQAALQQMRQSVLAGARIDKKLTVGGQKLSLNSLCKSQSSNPVAADVQRNAQFAANCLECMKQVGSADAAATNALNQFALTGDAHTFKTSMKACVENQASQGNLKLAKQLCDLATGAAATQPDSHPAHDSRSVRNFVKQGLSAANRPPSP